MLVSVLCSVILEQRKAGTGFNALRRRRTEQIYSGVFL